MKKCPFCSSSLVPKIIQSDNKVKLEKGSIEIDTCASCGSLWFDKGEAEEIPYSKLPELFDPEVDSLTPTSLVSPCPVCDSILKPLQSENLPAEAKAHFCPSCRGILFSPSDLLKYKKNQLSKFSYFQQLNIPLPSRSLFLTGLIAFLLSLTILALMVTKNTFDNRTRAAQLISKPFVTSLAPSRLTLTFTTKTPMRSKIQIEAPYITQPRILPIANDPVTLHQITLQDLRPATEYSYQVLVYDENDIKTTSEEFTFKTP